MSWSDKTFIVYRGTEVNHETIKSALEEKCPENYEIFWRYSQLNNMLFGKIIFTNSSPYKEPYFDSNTGLLSISGYNEGEIALAQLNFPSYKVNDSRAYHVIINKLYNDYKEETFKMLSKYMHFCAVIWDSKSNSIIAGVSEPNSLYTYLYYGYTRKCKEIMFSNDIEILQRFCDNIQEMDNNTYMKDGEIYTLDGEKVEKDKNAGLIENTKENANFSFEALNSLLMQITDETIRKKIAGFIEEYLTSNNTQEKVNDFIFNKLDAKTREQILQIIKNTLDEFSLEHELETRLINLFDEKLNEYISKIDVPRINIIKLGDTVLGQTQGGFYHEKFEQILSQVQLDEPIMLIGPAGSGKNVAISQVAEALGQHMYYTNNASNEFKLTGFIDAGGNYRDTEFYKAFKNGGIFFLDEIDNSDPSALIVINSALANGYMAFPHETIERHPDFRIIAAANTWGKGADLQYVGRNILDAATLDRFDNIFFDYDPNLEKALYPNDEVLSFMWSFRNAVYKSKISHIVSTRGIGKVYKKEINGIPVQDILTSNVVKNLGQDDVNIIIGNMENISSNNKYYDGIKSLKLRR